MRRVVRSGLSILIVIAALGAGPSAAHAADPIEGRWEFVGPGGQPVPGPVMDFVAAGAGAFTNKYVRPWPIGACSSIDGEFELTRISAPAAEPAYRGTATGLTPLTPCVAERKDDVEAVIRADGMLLVFFKNGSGVIWHLQPRSLRIDPVSFTFRERIEQAVAELAPQVRKLGRQRDDVRKEIVESHARARRAADTSKEGRRIRGLQRELAVGGQFLETKIAPLQRRDPDNPGLRALRAEWEAELRKLEDEILGLQGVLMRAEQRRGQAERALQSGLQKRSELNGRLYALARRLTALDFDVGEVTVKADGRLVLRALGSAKVWEQLQDLNARRRIAERALGSLETERRDAKAEFDAAQRRAITAGERLIDVFWADAGEGFAVDAGFLALDLGLAFAKGGFIGLAAETASKAAEAALKVVFPAKSADDAFGAEFKARYGASLKDSYSGPALERVAGERALKETFSKALVKDPATKYLIERVYDLTKFKTAFREGVRGALVPAPGRERLSTLARAAARDLAPARKRIAGFFKRRSGAKFVTDVAKDALKATLKRRLEVREFDAWQDYFEADLYARTLWPAVQAASTYYWEAKDGYDALLAEQERLRREFTVDLVEPFARGATLQIALKGQGAPGTLAVLVGGTRAKHLGGYVYELASAGAVALPNGSVALEVR